VSQSVTRCVASNVLLTMVTLKYVNDLLFYTLEWIQCYPYNNVTLTHIPICFLGWERGGVIASTPGTVHSPQPILSMLQPIVSDSY
jgi:hypothetical protein